MNVDGELLSHRDVLDVMFSNVLCNGSLEVRNTDGFIAVFCRILLPLSPRLSANYYLLLFAAYRYSIICVATTI